MGVHVLNNFILPHTLRRTEINPHRSIAIYGLEIAWTGSINFSNISSIYYHPPKNLLL